MVGLAGFGDAEWRWKLGISAVPAAFFLVMLFTIPRSPRWLVSKGRIEEARQVLKLTGEEDFERNLQEIIESIDLEHRRGEDRLFSRQYRAPIFLAVSIGVFNQLTGINAILYYLNSIFENAGFSKVSGDLQSVAVGATNLLFTIIAMSVIDRFGRKILLLVGSIGMALCLAGVAAIFFLGTNQHLLVWLLMGYIAAFGFSQGAVIWVYLSEVFPNRVRAKGLSLGSSAHWVMNAFISGLFPIMAASSGGFPFIFFALMMVMQFFVVLWWYPETKNISLEQMQKKMGIA
jgi:sugar porter (SP) family MFS transporter